MNLAELENNLEYKTINFPKVFSSDITQVTGSFNLDTNLNTSSIETEYLSFSKHRLIEFVAGRICALKAINMLTPSDIFLTMDKNNKKPIWPKGFTGSISHSRNLVSAAVTPTNQKIGIGIDLQMIFNTETALDLAEEILSPEEKFFFNSYNFVDVITLIYSAKEAAYKALGNFTDKFLNYEDIKLVSLNFSSKIFKMEINPKKSMITKLKGSFVFYDSYVSTGVEIKIP